MDYELRFQDPSSTSTRYLFEEIVGVMLDPTTTLIEGMFAFASARAVADLMQDAALKDYLARAGRMHLIVGLDAITDRRTLELLRDLEVDNPGLFVARVYKNSQPGLFHPKLLRSSGGHGRSTLIVGSGNFTPGGLRNNIEAYSVLRYDPDADAPISEWDVFIDDHEDEITEIDQEALDAGQRNADRARAVRRIGERLARGGGRAPGGEDASDISVDDVASPGPSDRMLIAEVPAAGGRWHQVHFNEEVVRVYFRARPNSADRIYLYRYESGTLVAEPPRPVVFPPRNVNHRIEFGARPGAPYPPNGRPILVLRELGVRIHEYVLLFPGDPGHTEMDALLGSRPSVGRGLRRVIVTHGETRTAWPALPI